MKIVSRLGVPKPHFSSKDTTVMVDCLLPNDEQETPDAFFKKLCSYLENLDAEEILLVTNHANLQIHASEEEILKLFENFNVSILFGASAHFDFESEALRYYYWKFYPRMETLYDFIDSRYFIGKVKDLKSMAEDILRNYELDGSTILDLLHRIYVDSQSMLIKANYTIALDHKHLLFGSTAGRMAVHKWPLFSKSHSFLFFEQEKKLLTKRGLLDYQNTARDYKKTSSRPSNKKTGSSPAIFIGSANRVLGWSIRASLFSMTAYIRSIVSLLKITFFNKGNPSQERIFRYAKNQGKELSHSIAQVMNLLRNNVPFSFSHFNDGEITFIKKYLEKDHKEVWFGGRLFGRFQDQYNEKLGKLLVDSFEMQQQNYFVGTPCKSCHPSLHNFSEKARKADQFTVPAMTFHHNLSYYPEMLGLIKEKKAYFVVNPHQDLSFFKAIGFQIDPSQHIKVPFKNAHNVYENLKELKFEEGSVVLLMCGMLAKILCAHWFKNQPNVTYIAFGSSFDDFIQENINFNLYPNKYPFSRHIIGSRGYLFGSKPRCEVCFDLGNSTSQTQ